LNKYNNGAMEALSWAYAKLRKCESIEDFQGARNEIKDMIMHLSNGAAVRFKRRAYFMEVL